MDNHQHRITSRHLSKCDNIEDMQKGEYFEGIMDVLIATFTSSRNPRHFRSILRERKLARYKKGTVRTALYRLRKKGYLKNSSVGWSATKRGKAWKKNKGLKKYLPSPFEKNSPQNSIISFDIPVRKRALRNWLREQIKIFDYEMLQQSLWIGPGPLPVNFLNRLENLGIRKNIKIFKIKKT